MAVVVRRYAATVIGVSYSPRMALYQELTGQGRVVGGHLAGGTVLSGGAAAFSKNGDLAIQHSSNPFRRHKVNAETVREWEKLDPRKGLAGAIGQAAARAALPGAVGKAVGAGLGAAFDSGHILKVIWADGKQSVIELPEKQFMVLSILLEDRKVIAETHEEPEPSVPPQGVAGRIAGLASSTFAKARQTTEAAENAPTADPTEQIAKLASLHAQGVLTDAEFSEKKAELLKRL